MAASWMVTLLPLGAIPANSPRWVPLDVNRMTTRSLSAMMSSTFSFQSGNAARWPATSLFDALYSFPLGSPNKVADKVSGVQLICHREVALAPQIGLGSEDDRFIVGQS